MSDVEIGRPEGRTQYSDKSMEIYEQQRRPGEPLGAGEYVHVVEGYLRE